MDFTECYVDTVSGVAAAARSGSRKRVKTLIKRGFSVDCRDNRGWNALHEAAAAGSQGCVQEILSTVGKEGFTVAVWFPLSLLIINLDIKMCS